MGNGVYVEIEVVDFYLSLKADSPAGEVALPRVRATCVINSPALRVSNGQQDLFKAWVNRCALHVKPMRAEQDTGPDSRENGLFLFIPTGESFPSGVEAEVSLNVDQTIFDKLVSDMQRGGSKCLISFETTEPSLVLDSNFKPMRIHDVEFRFQTTLLPGKAGPVAPTAEYERVVDECCLPGKDYGTLRRSIGEQLALSMAKSKAVPSSWDLDQLRQVMHLLQSGFHPYFLEKDLPNGLFEQEPAEFEKAVADLPDKEKNALRASYSMVWLHTPMESVATQGEKNTASAKSHLVPNVDVIEELGRLYYRNPNFVSPSLEWVIVDSLMYYETLELTRSLAETTRKLAYFYDRPLGPVSFKMQALEHITHGFGRLVKEVFAWGVTGVVAGVVSSLSSIGFWPIFLLMTAVRWVRPKKDINQENLMATFKLTTDMISAYRKLSDYDFNAGLMLAQLHALEIRGASFKTAIYNVLEKRQARGIASS